MARAASRADDRRSNADKAKGDLHAQLDLSALMLVAASLLSAPALAQDAERVITHIAGSLYRFQNNFHYSVFLVTPEGVIATDPINAEAARWLEGEIEERFDKEIEYVIYSHDHADHIAGGEVFADTAVVIAHENAKKDIIGESRPTAVPDITFTQKMTVELGGKTVELIFPGRSHSDNLIVMRFPGDAVFTVDFISVKRLPYASKHVGANPGPGCGPRNRFAPTNGARVSPP